MEFTKPLLPILADGQEKPEVTKMWEEICAALNKPTANNYYRVLGNSPVALGSVWAMTQAILAPGRVEVPVRIMIFAAVSAALDCKYCETQMLIACKMMGVDSEQLEKVAKEAERPDITPPRLAEMIQFAVKCGVNSRETTHEDVQRLRDLGLDDEEIGELAVVGIFGHMQVMVADALQVPVDESAKAMREELFGGKL